VLENRLHKRGGGALPLGGLGELLGGHKGYGLALMVEVLSAILPGAAIGVNTYPRSTDGKPLPADLGHLFCAIKIDAFRPLDQFKADMDDTINRLKKVPKIKGADRVYIHGEKEFEEAERRAAKGIPLSPDIEADLMSIAKELNVAYDL
jgi:LDH2 family malate/lactate/ureidoglycolate dehydrogenase